MKDSLAYTCRQVDNSNPSCNRRQCVLRESPPIPVHPWGYLHLRKICRVTIVGMPYTAKMVCPSTPLFGQGICRFMSIDCSVCDAFLLRPFVSPARRFTNGSGKACGYIRPLTFFFLLCPRHRDDAHRRRWCLHQPNEHTLT